MLLFFSTIMADGLLRFDGRVALVTGAGGGLGREYALAFAARGASVVVNDLGGSGKGEGKSSTAADKVVAEIRAKGGTAVANYDSVEDGEKVVKTALDHFGRIDIVVNNAGILRDRSFARISDLDWDLIQRVHLRGSFLVTRAAWPHMKKNKFGKVIMTSSTSGIYGNFGQANYGAAKLGLIGLSNTLAIEGAKYNISCNAIVPIASSRLTQSILSPELLEAYKPVYVAPLVLYLCHDSCLDSGGVFSTVSGSVAKLQWQTTQGKVLRRHNTEVTPEVVRDNWAAITDWSGATRYSNSAEATAGLLTEKLEEAKGDADNTESVTDVVDKAKSHKFPPWKFSYGAKDIILYALGVGVSVKKDMSHLKFLYEGSDDFCALPSFCVIPAQMGLQTLAAGKTIGFKIDPTRILHGEQYLEIYKPLPTSCTLTNKVEIVDIMDKGKGAVILENVTSYNEEGELVCFNQFSIYAGGAGGFGGKRNSDKGIPLGVIPTRAPDASIKERTGPSQAALYRLNGDYNPLHVDPAFAQMGGFSTPILHGLVSFGIATRHILKQFANDDVTKFKAIKVRFVKPVLPGQTIQTDMWKDGSRVHFQCKAVESGHVVLSSAYMDLIGLQDITVPDVNSLVSKPTGSGLKSEALFGEFSRRISDRPELVKKVKGVFFWNVTKDGKTVGQWTVDLKNGAGGVNVGPPKAGKPDCSITVSDDDLVAIATGKSNPQQLFMKGKLKVKGNIMLTTKLDQLFQQERAKL